MSLVMDFRLEEGLHAVPRPDKDECEARTLEDAPRPRRSRRQASAEQKSDRVSPN